MKLEKWQEEIASALASGKLKMLSATEIEIRRRAAQRKAMHDWIEEWGKAHKVKP